MTTLRLNKNLHVNPQFSCNVKNLFLSLFVVVCFVNDTNTHAITVTTSAAPIIASQLSNISTRGFVQTGDNVMIAGFIIQGTQPRGSFRVPLVLSSRDMAFPMHSLIRLELHDGGGALIASNDNLQHTIVGGIITAGQVVEIQNSGHAPGERASRQS